MSVRRTSVDVVPRREDQLVEGDKKLYDIQFGDCGPCHPRHRSVSNAEEKPIDTVIQWTMTANRSIHDIEGVIPTLHLVLAYVASNTSFFSEKAFRSNLTELVDHLTNLHGQQVSIWKRDMFLALQGGKASISNIRKLVRVNGFDLDSDIGPIPKKQRSSRDPKFHTALTWASWQGNLNLVKLLIAEGANPNALTSQGLSALHCSAMRNDDNNLAVLKYFLEHPRFKIGIDFCTDRDGITALMCASSFGAYNIAEYLLQQNAEVNRQDAKGQSALFYAAKGGHLKLIQLLVNFRACLYLRDNDNATVLHHLLSARSSSRNTTNTILEILIYLVDVKGLSVLNKASNGCTALHEACQSGLYSAVFYLLDKGANLEAKKKGWETALWTTVMGKFHGHKLIMLLLEKGANFETRNCLGMTVFQYAKQIKKNSLLNESLEQVRKLLRARRMKALLDKRRAILNFPATTNKNSRVDDSNNACTSLRSSFTSASVKRGWFQSEEIYIDNNNDANEGLIMQEGNKKALFSKNELVTNFEDECKNEASCSDISSDSLLSEISGEENDDDIFDDGIIIGKNTKTGSGKSRKIINDNNSSSEDETNQIIGRENNKKGDSLVNAKEIADNSSISSIEDEDCIDYCNSKNIPRLVAGIGENFTDPEDEDYKNDTDIENEEDDDSDSSSSEDDDNDPSDTGLEEKQGNNNRKDFDEDQGKNDNRGYGMEGQKKDGNGYENREKDRKSRHENIENSEGCNKDNADIEIGDTIKNSYYFKNSSVEALSINPNNYDENDCFERLLRKKRLLEHENQKRESVIVPQKIQCVQRRVSVMISSDSD